MSVVLIYDSSKNTGHHFEYINSLLNGVKNDIYKLNKYYFVLNSCMKTLIDENSLDIENCEIIYIDDYTLEKWNKLNAFFRSIAEIYYIYTISLEKKVRRILFLMIDRYQYALGINKGLFYNIDIEGILFKPYIRYNLDRTGLSRYFKSSLFYFYKWLGIAILMRNQSKKKIWVLNDKKSSQVFNKNFNTNSFCYLPDPVKKTGSIKDFDFLDTYGIKLDSKILIIFGSISPFKNIENILKALYELNISCITLLILGSWTSRKYKTYINQIIEDYRQKCPSLQIILEDRYFEEDEIDFLISKSCCVLIPYINFYFSSGVLGRSSSLEKPVIGSKKTLCEELIDTYSLGVTVDPSKPAEIANGIRKVLLGDSISSKDGMRRYVDEREYVRFISLLLAGNASETI